MTSESGRGGPEAPGPEMPGPEVPGPEESERETRGPDADRPASRRLHPATIAVVAVEALRQNLLPLAVIAAIAVLGGGGTSAQSLVRLAVYGVLATAVVAATGYVRWSTTTYRLDEDAIHVRRGLLQRQHAAVPIERISGIDTVQGPMHRLFSVTEVQIQAAGGGQEPEISLPALSGEAVDELRRHAARQGVAAEVTDTSERRPPLRVLPRRALVLAAATAGQFTVLLPVLAALSQGLDRALGPDSGEAIRRYLPPETLGTALVALAVLLVAAWALAFAGTIVAFANFTVERDPERLRISRGLLQRRVSTIPVARIQAIRIVEGVLRQPLGLASLRVESAGYAGERSANTTLFPLLPRAEVDRFLRSAVPELAAPLEPLAPPPARARWLYVGTPALAAALAAAPLAVLVTPLALALVPLAVGAGVARQRAAGHRLGHGFLVVRARRLARTTIVAAGLRLPERSFEQGPVARRLRLATLAFALASRTRWQVAHLEAATVSSLVDALRPPAALRSTPPPRAGAIGPAAG